MSREEAAGTWGGTAMSANSYSSFERWMIQRKQSQIQKLGGKKHYQLTMRVCRGQTPGTYPWY